MGSDCVHVTLRLDTSCVWQQMRACLSVRESTLVSRGGRWGRCQQVVCGYAKASGADLNVDGERWELARCWEGGCLCGGEGTDGWCLCWRLVVDGLGE